MGPHLSPAPWRTDPECGDESVLDANGFMVADCAIFGRGSCRERNVANARAIAALPGLLAEIAALKRALVRHNCGKPTCICVACCREEDARNESKTGKLEPQK